MISIFYNKEKVPPYLKFFVEHSCALGQSVDSVAEVQPRKQFFLLWNFPL